MADFARGRYYDSFDPDRDVLPEGHQRGLELEEEGSRRRIRDFYGPLIRRVLPGAQRVLDAGCGNGISVDELAAAGFEAWGNDLSQLRKYQWRERESRARLVVADATRLPFPDEYFDVVISSGVIEHIGVAESPAPDYAVRALDDQHELRLSYLRELSRVTRRGGRLFVDCPNGRFPIDFWHGNSPGSPRFHPLSERFLPSYREIRALAEGATGGGAVSAHSPRIRLQFRQAADHLHGRLFGPLVALEFRIMQWPGFRWLARSPLNPFLVVEIERR